MFLNSFFFITLYRDDFDKTTKNRINEINHLKNEVLIGYILIKFIVELLNDILVIDYLYAKLDDQLN
jgi:hypothetical protein